MNQQQKIVPDESNIVEKQLAQDFNPEQAGNNSSDNAYYVNETPESEFNLWQFIGILKRRKQVMGFTMVGILCLAFVYTSLTPRIYRASIDLLVNTSKNSSGGSSDSLPAISDLLQATSTRSQDTEAEILRSGSILDAATALLPPALRGASGKDSQVTVQLKGETDVITVGVQSQNPAYAEAFSSAIGEAYRLQNQKNNSAQYGETADYVRGQLEVVRRKLNEKRRELQKFKESNHIVDLSTESQQRVTRLAQLQSVLEDTEADRASNASQLQKLRAQVTSMAPAEIAPDTIVTSPVVDQLRTQLTTLETQRFATLEKFMPNSPEVQSLNGQIDALRQRLNKEASTEVGTYKRNINPVRQAAMQAISQAQSNVWADEARISAVRGGIVRSQNEISQLPGREYTLTELQSDLATYQQTFQSLSDKYQTLLISQKTPVANARIITHSRSAQIKPRVLFTLISSVIFGGIFATILALVVDSLDDRIHTEALAVEVTGLPVLTHIPLSEKDASQQLLIHQDDSSVMLESFRMLRTQLSFITSYGHMKSLLVTSSQPGEGKSTVASNLAVALALNDKKVVLLDADLRRPRVHRIFNLENNKGFSAVIANLCTLEDALHDTDLEGLKILTAGPTPPNPPELLDSRASRDIIERLNSMFDYVIIDAPPALMIADAQVISTMTDGIVLVVSCKEARKGGVKRTYDVLSQSGSKITGMVLNKFTDSQSSYYGYNYLGYKSYSKYMSDNDEEGLVVKS